MTKWTIYGRDGKARCECVTGFTGDERRPVMQDTLEYTGKWMGESFVTVSVKSPYPIDFQIGDYIVYRGERFTINYDPTAIKKARRGSYGEGFTYDSIKFNSLSNELTEIMFHDWVLSDNKLHYTSLPNFSFYCKDVDDLADRLQANTDRWCKANGFAKEDYWIFYTLRNNTTGTADKGQTQTTYERTVQRAQDISADATFTANVKAQWEKVYGTGSDYKDSRDDERYDRTITASTQSVWDMMAAIKQQFGLNFIIRGRNVYIGTAGVPAGHLFKYGKGNGLYEVDKTADQDQKVVTKLHAYGSDENLPTRYYANLNAKPCVTVTKVQTTEVTDNDTSMFLVFDTNLLFSSSYFTNPVENVSGTYLMKVHAGSTAVTARAYSKNATENTTQMSVGWNGTGSTDNTKETVEAFKALLATGVKLYMDTGVNKSTFPSSNLEYDTQNLPDNMAVNYLMLPGFPNNSLSALCKAEYSSDTDTTTYYIRKSASESYVAFHTESGRHIVTFSGDQYDPYILSPNADALGVKEGDIFCNEENDDNGLKKVYPTIEEVTNVDAGITTGNSTDRVDAVAKADVITDNGVWPNDKSSEIPGFNIYIPALGFDLRQAAKDAGGSEMKISMKNGFCGGRTFDVANVSQEKDGTWKLDCKRSLDNDLDIYFPYSYAASVQGVSSDMTNAYQILAGDNYVLTGIAVSDVNYVWAASVKLLRKAIHWLCKNDYTRYVYTPKIDEIYMARQDAAAKADKTGATVSLHDTLKEGDMLLFEDDDLMLSGAVYIDQLTIKENGNNGIPTYEVTLRNETQVGTIQRIQNQVDSIRTDIDRGNIGGGGGVSPTQVDPLIKAYGAKYFLSKISPDTAQKEIRFREGIKTGDGSYGIDGKGEAEFAKLVANQIMSEVFNDDLIGGKGFHYWVDTDGRSHVITDFFTARVKAFFAELEIRKVSSSLGNIVFSNAGSRIAYVEEYKQDGFTGWKCWFEADDGTTATTNSWQIGDQAQCRTFNVKSGVYQNVSNRYYWRLVIGTGEGKILDKDGNPIDDKTYGYVILADYYTTSDNKQTTLVDTLADSDGNTIQPYGASETTKAYFRLKQTDEMPEGWTLNDAPVAGDSIVQLGNQTADGVAIRGNAMQIVTNSDAAVPSLNMYSAINDYDLSKFQVVQISPAGIVATVRLADIKIVNDAGNPVNLFNFVGAYPTDGTKPKVYKGDVYTYEGQTWAWDGANEATPDAPSETVAGWTLVASKGDDGSATLDYYELTAEPGALSIGPNYETKRYVTVRLWHVEGASRKEVKDSGANVECGRGIGLFKFPVDISTNEEDFEDADGIHNDSAEYLADKISEGKPVVSITDTQGRAPALLVPVIRDGTNGRSVTDVDIEYNNGTESAANETDWDTHANSFLKIAQKDGYLWERTKTTYSDKTVTYSVARRVGAVKDLVKVTELYKVDGTVAPSSVVSEKDINRDGWKTREEFSTTDEDKGHWVYTCDEIVWGTPANGNYVTYTEPVQSTYIPKDGSKGNDGLSLAIYYALSANATSASASDFPSDLEPLFQPNTSTLNSDVWTVNLPDVTADKPYQWAASVLMNGTKLASSVIYYRVNIKDGETPKIEIGENGNWFINGEDQNVKAQGEKGDDGHSPYIKDGYWWYWDDSTGDYVQGDKAQGGPGQKGDDAITYEIDPVTEEASVSIEKSGDAGDKIQVTGKLNVNCQYNVYMKTGGVRAENKLAGVSISAKFNNGDTGLTVNSSSLSVTASNISYSSTDSRTSVIITFTYSNRVIGVRTVPVTFAPASMIQADTQRWTQIYANGDSISALQQDADSIHMKVDRLPSRNLLRMGSVGETAVKGDVVWGPMEAPVTAGRQYTVTWKGHMENPSAYIKFYVSVDGSTSWANSSEPFTTASTGYFRRIFTPQASGQMKVYVQYMNKDNVPPSSYDYKIYTEWVRVDEGDHITREADRLTEWEPSDADLQAVNLLPDHKLESTVKAYSDEFGTRDVVNGQQQDASSIVTLDGIQCVRIRRSGVYGNKTYDSNGNTIYDGGEIFDGLRWYIPFRGAGKYTISGSFKNMRTNTASEKNFMGFELQPCDGNKNRLTYNKKGVACWLWESDTVDYGWKHIEQTPDKPIDAYERDADGNSKAVEWLEVRLYMTQDGDMAASRLCVAKCDYGTIYDAQDKSTERQNEATQLATGLDIYQHRIRAVADMFEWWSNSGDRFAYYDTQRGVAVFNGNIYATGGSFTGDVTATTFTGPEGAFRVLANGATIATGMIDYSNFYVCNGADGTDVLAVHSNTLIAGQSTAIAFYYNAHLNNGGNPQSDRITVDSNGGRNLLIAGGASSGLFPMTGFGDTDGAGPYIGIGSMMTSVSPTNIIATLLNSHLLATPKVLTDSIKTKTLAAQIVRFGVEVHSGSWYLGNDSSVIQIFTNTSNNQTVTFPSNPEDFTCFIIVQAGGSLSFNPNGKNIGFGNRTTGNAGETTSSHSGQWTFCIYDGQGTWQCCQMGTSPF